MKGDNNLTPLSEFYQNKITDLKASSVHLNTMGTDSLCIATVNTWKRLLKLHYGPSVTMGPYQLHTLHHHSEYVGPNVLKCHSDPTITMGRNQLHT